MWLLKPTGFNRGIGIHIFQTWEQLCEIMGTSYGIGRGAKDKVSIFQQHNINHYTQLEQDKYKSFSFVIQKLIERPLLFQQRKFDVRLWVLFNSSDGKVYLYQEGYVRTSSKEYIDLSPEMSDADHLLMQLTNNAVQQNTTDYGKHEEGNIVSMDQLFTYVSKTSNKTKDQLISEFNESCKNIISNTFRSVKGKLKRQNYTFELFGYDFILDENLNNYLIEANTNPCLEEPNELLRRLIPRMVDDMLNIVCDPIFNPSQADQYTSTFQLPGQLFGPEHDGYKDDLNLWEHICNFE